MSMKRERITTIIPAYNAARFLAEAVASIRAQTLCPDEIIIVDDASTDGTADIASGLGNDIRLLRLADNQGPAVARNRGIMAATGTLITGLDADDIWPPNALAALAARLEQFPAAGIVAGCIEVIGPALPARPISRTTDVLEGFAQSFGCSMIRRQTFQKVGLLDETLRFGEDMDWFMRARERNIPIVTIGETTLLYRRHGSNMTVDPHYTMHVGLEMLKRSLERRRSTNDAAVSLPAWPAPDQE